MTAPHLAPLSGQVFGLHVAANRPVPGFAPSSQSAIDVHVHFEPKDAGALPAAEPDYRSLVVDSHGVPLARGWDLADGTRLVAANTGARARIDRTASNVWLFESGVIDDDLAAWLLGPIFALVLRRRGVVPLHASAVQTGRGAAILAGTQGAGKSTLAAVLAMRGAPVIADDVAALEHDGPGDPIRVRAGPTFIRARRGAIETAAIELGRHADLALTPDGRYCDFDSSGRPDRRASDAVPVREIFWLGDQRASSQSDASIEPMGAADAVVALTSDTWIARWQAREERADEFRVLSRLVLAVPVYRVRWPQAAVIALADRVLAFGK